MQSVSFVKYIEEDKKKKLVLCGEYNVIYGWLAFTVIMGWGFWNVTYGLGGNMR